MKTDDLKDLRDLLGTIEFANAQLEQSVKKLEQFKDIEKLVPILENLREIDLSKHLEKIDFAKIGQEVFMGLKQSINAQSTIITNSVQTLQQKSHDLNTITKDLQELDELASNLRDLKKSIKGLNLKLIIVGMLIGVGMGAIGGYIYFNFIKQNPFQKLLSSRASIIEESNGFKDILVINAPFKQGAQNGTTWIAFTYPQTQQTTPQKDQK